MTRLIDLSHTIEHGTLTYKGLPAPIVCDFLSREASKEIYDEGTSFHIGSIELVGNTGTYLDSPFHRFADGKDLSELPLESVTELDALLFRVAQPDLDGLAIGADLFASMLDSNDVGGKAVLVQTGWDQHWATDQYFEGHPHLTADAAEWLKSAGAKLVGIDSYNIDDVSTGERPVHSTLLGAEIPIVEHLCRLSEIPDGPFKFCAAPVKVKSFGTFPVRAYAVVA